MKAFLETTEWKLDHPMNNHIYLLSGSKDKMYAYVKHGTNEVFEFKKPYKFKAGGRKFKEVENVWGYVQPDDQPVGRTWTVAGSKGAKYTVSEHLGSWACTCVGFKYHGDCKHIRELNR